jgi:hypothetical protein
VAVAAISHPLLQWRRTSKGEIDIAPFAFSNQARICGTSAAFSSCYDGMRGFVGGFSAESYAIT